jgi:hypothetical protein
MLLFSLNKNYEINFNCCYSSHVNVIFLSEYSLVTLRTSEMSRGVINLNAKKAE